MAKFGIVLVRRAAPGASGMQTFKTIRPPGLIHSLPFIIGELMETTWTRDVAHRLTQNDAVVGSVDTVAVIFD